MRHDSFATSGISGWAASRIRNFRKDQQGSVLVLSLFLVLGMMLVAGVAIDFVRAEHMRVKLQGTLDRAVLAAAAYDEDGVTAQQKKDIVIDYFTKAGLLAFLDIPSLEVGGEGSGDEGAVFASARANVPTIFIDAVGIDYLAAPATVAATQGLRPIEIVMVLDVSGSMNGSAGGGKTRIGALKESAVDFVEAVLENPDNQDVAQELTTIAMVPYSWTVNMGTDITKYYGHEAGWLNAVDTDTGCFAFLANPLVIPLTDIDSEYGPESTSSWSVAKKKANAHWLTAEMNPALGWPRTPYADSYSSRSSKPSNGLLDCMSDQNQRAQGFTNNPGTMKTAINRLVANGSTSMDIGMKWGMHLIDPSFRPVMNQIIDNDEFIAAAGTNSDLFVDRPIDYDKKVEKYIILMSDGDNKPNYTLKDGYRVGMSPIWVGTSSGTTRYSFYDQARAKVGLAPFYIPQNSSSERWKNTAYGSSPTQLSWKKVWERETVAYVAYEIYAKWMNAKDSSKSITTYYEDLYSKVRGDYNNDSVGVEDTAISLIQRAGSSTKDERLQAICDVQDEKKSVKIFTIAFRDDIAEPGSPVSTWSPGERALYKCATTPSFYYPANDPVALAAAFSSIAANINKLRLTQ